MSEQHPVAGRPPDPSYQVETSTTRHLPSDERTEFWTDLVSSYHCALQLNYPIGEDFHGATVRQRSNTYQLVGWRSGENMLSRTPRAIRLNPDEDYRLIFPVSGRMAIHHAGRKLALHPGRAGLTPMSTPFRLWQSRATEAFVMTIPRRELDLRLDFVGPQVATLDLASGLGRVVIDLAVALFRERDTLSRNHFDAVCDRLVELMCMLVAGDDCTPSPGRLDELDAAIRRYVRTHAGDPELSPHSLAATLGWSLRQVQLALQATGTTPRRLIKDERLRIAQERLRSGARMSLTDLAHQLGFSSLSAFSNAFRERYGLYPSELRGQPPQSH